MDVVNAEQVASRPLYPRFEQVLTLFRLASPKKQVLVPSWHSKESPPTFALKEALPEWYTAHRSDPKPSLSYPTERSTVSASLFLHQVKKKPGSALSRKSSML